MAEAKESPVIQRRTQTAVYWQEQFHIGSQELSRVYDLILDAGQPVPAAVLAQTLIGDQCRQEEAQLQAELSRGPVYEPQEAYQVGQELAFSAFDYAWGTVVGSRQARNPAYGEFTAIQVRLEKEDRIREFASGLQGEHKLNRKEGQPRAMTLGEVQSPADLHAEYGSTVEEKLAVALQERSDFVRFGDNWFLRELMVEVNVGQLNIAEALIEIKGMPVPTADLMSDLDLPAEVPEAIKNLSLKRAFEADGRFVNVGDGGRDIWYLVRLAPQAVTNPPARLLEPAEPYSRRDISQELSLIEREIDDEAGAGDPKLPSRPIYRTTVILTYPHLRSGTLPLTARTQGLFPRPTARYTPVVLVDAQSGDRMQGWIVTDGSFVYGLAEWYQRYSLPVGAFIKLEKTRDPRVITVDLEPQRLKRIWVKVVTVRDKSLAFQMRKLPVSCQFDEHMIIADDDPAAVDEFQAELSRGETLFDILVRIMPELVKLSPQGTVHAKTIYSAVNVLRRTPAGPIFALLSTEPCFVAMGGGYFTFDESRI